jgi:5'(3')-deoxyribonucleotidase
MKKLKVFIDFDEVIANTSQALCHYYNNNYFEHPKWEEASIEKMFKYDFSDACPLMVNRHGVFNEEEFFKYLYPNSYMVSTLILLKNDFDFILCSTATRKNAELKLKWLTRHFKDDIMKAHIFTDGHNSKSIINMEGGVIIDDHKDNIINTNARIKIVFGRETDWNSGMTEGRDYDFWAEDGKDLYFFLKGLK